MTVLSEKSSFGQYEVADLVALRAVPGVQLRISDCLCQLVARKGSRRVRWDVVVRRRRARHLAVTRVSVGLVPVDDPSRPVDETVVGTVLRVGAGSGGGIEVTSPPRWR